ncbi:MAG: DNA/RNA nuclease SfsA [Alphaproteobacteria bacterium]|jgi:sugar fermentation stimulation protein A|nr:DNA/RNA nuclease SfsA [Alphaproteobacteria bacterium]
MQFAEPLIPARLVQRYKRVLADVVFPDGAPATVHVPNTGKMLGVSDPGATVWLSKARPGRKLGWSLHLVEADGGLVGVDTSLPNVLATEAIQAGIVAELKGYASLRREVKYGHASRIDILLEQEGRPPCYVEVKNVHLRRTGDLAEFPDCVAARSSKHMGELADMVDAGARAVVLFVIQREDCQAFAPAADLDPTFAAALRAAAARGVEVLAYACALATDSVTLTRPLAVRL